jgi:hypothetical protein
MKLTCVIAIAVVIAFPIIWCVQIWSAERWNPALQGDGEGSFHEIRQTNENVENNTPVSNTTEMSTPSWGDRLQKLIHHYARATKSVDHRSSPRSRLAPHGVYFTVTYLSVRNGFGITGLEPGTQVVCVKDEGPVLRVKAGNLEFEAKRQHLTNDLDIAGLAARNDAEAQQAIAAYIAQQQQAIDQRNNNWRIQASRGH